MTDGVVARERGERLRREHVGNEAGLLVDAGPLAVADRDAGGLLAAMLQGEQAEECQLCHALAVRGRDAEDTAFVLGGVVVRQGRHTEGSVVLGHVR